MTRLSNRILTNNQNRVPEIQYIETVVEKIIEIPVIKEIEVEKIVHVQSDPIEVDFKSIYENLSQTLIESHSRHANQIEELQDMLELQGRALVQMKQDKNIDRGRRLQLLMRLKKHKEQDKKNKFKLHLAIVASCLLSVITLIVKL